MASILVVEQEQRSLEKITKALASEGWRIRTVPGRVQALQAAAAETPDLVLLSSDTPSADELARAFQRSAGGPGVVVILPEHAEVGSGALPADDRLARPFSDQDLRNVVRRALSIKRLGGTTNPTQVRLTSQDIFGDVLAEVEGQGGLTGRGVGRAASSAAAPPQRTAAQRDAEAINRKLEQTLHGVMNTESKPRPASAARDLERTSVDALLSKTLSNLELPTRPRPAAPAAVASTTPAPALKAPAPSAPPLAPPAAAPLTAAAPSAPTVRIPDVARSIERPPSAPPVRPPEPAPVAKAPEPVMPAPATAAPDALEPLSMLAPELPQPAPIPRPAATTVKAPAPTLPRPATASPAASRVEETTGTGIKKLGRSTGEFDLSQLDELAYPRRARPDTSRPPAPTMPVTRPPDAAATQRIAIPRDDDTGGGERFGQYSLLEKIAVGGMAEVWKARMRGVEGFQKTVAIKKILPHMTDNAEFVGMFIDEAKLAAQLNHPNIIHIYDLGKIGRDYYIAMEFVEGKDLRSLLNAARRQGISLPMGLALLIAARLADALDYAHNKRDFDGRGMGLVHRDVSPQNVLLSLDGDVKLCDFGIAKAVSKAAQTQMGALKGKLQYMSPEQAWGKPVDQRSDLFSLGAILFEMLTGERLFTGDTEISVLESVRQARVRSVRQVDPSVPHAVDEIVDRALASKAEDRFQTAVEMKQRIEAVVHSLKVQPTAADLAGFVRQVVSGATRDESGAGLRTARPAVALPAVAAVATGTASGVTAAPAAPFAPIAPVGEVKVEEGRKGKALIYALAAVLLVAIGLGYFYYSRKQAQPGPVPTPAPAVPRAASGPTAGAIGPSGASGAAVPPKVDVEGMVGQEVAKQAEAMKQKFEDQKKALEKQIAQADATKAAAAKTPTPAPAAEAPAKTPPAATEPPAAQTPAPQPAAENPSRAAVPPPADPALTPQTTEIRPTEPAAEPPRRKETPAPSTKLGDLVVPGPGVVAPELVTVPKPEYPPLARKLKIQGVVVVSLLVDENGHVSDARISEPAEQKVGLDEAALAAAREARYKPAVKEGVRVKMWTRLKVPFKL